MKSETNKNRNLFSYSRYRELLNEAKMAFADDPKALASFDKLELDSYNDDIAKTTPEEGSNKLKMAFRDHPVNCAFLDLVSENMNSLEGLEDGAPDAIEMKRKLSMLYAYLMDLHQNKN